MDASSERMQAEMPAGGPDDNQGQLQVGRWILQLGSPEGAVLSPAADQPPARPRTEPVLLRPRPLPSLIGLETVVGAVRDALHAGRSALVHGAPGTGKTALLSQLAYQVPRSWYPDGTIYLRARYAGLSDLLQVLYDLFHEASPSHKPLADEVIAGLQNRQVLLLLDDVALPPEACQRLIQSLPRWRCVVACKQRLWLDNVYVHSLDGLSPDDALTLVERKLGYWVSSAEKPVIQRACASLLGNPLSLLQLVALAGRGQRSLAEVIADLDMERASETLQEQILLSLSEPERRVLSALAAADGIPLSAATLAAVTDLPQVGPVLEDLEHDYLVEKQGPYYLARSPLATALRQASDVTPWLWRVLSHTLESLQEEPASLDVDEEPLGAVPFLCAAAAQAAWWPEVIRLARLSEGPLALGQRWDAWEAVLLCLLQASRATSDRAAEAWALHQLGVRATCLGDARQGRVLLRRSLRQGKSAAARSSSRRSLPWLHANAQAPGRQGIASPGAGETPSRRRGALSDALWPILWPGIAAIAVVALVLALWAFLSTGSMRSKVGRPSPTTQAPLMGVGVMPPPETAGVPEATQPLSLPSAAPTSRPPTATPFPSATTVPSQTPSATATSTATPAIVYDFVASAAGARWRNSVQQVLSFPSRGSASPGLVRPYQGLLEDGQTAAAGLETRPNLVRRGFIRGYYRQSMSIDPGDCFRARVGFAEGAEGGQVLFRFSFDARCNGTYDARWELEKSYDGHVTEWFIPLDSLLASSNAPIRGCFALQVDAEQANVNDHAVWVEARIERP